MDNGNIYVPAKTIVTRNKSSEWFGADYNMNIYRGCSHGCIYCDSRSDCYRESDFDTVKIKENALEIIRDDLRRKVKKGIIGTGSMSDPYNPLEKTMKLTRNALELINAYGFGVAISTKGTLVTRDIDVLSDIREHSPVVVNITITCADDMLSEKIEPHAPLSGKRFEALAELAENKIYCGILLMPLLPFINDNEDNIGKIVELAAKSGVRYIYPAFGVTQRTGQREYFHAKLEEQFSGAKQKYINAYGEQYSCMSYKYKNLTSFFKNECSKYNIAHEMRTIINMAKRGYGDMQLSFL